MSDRIRCLTRCLVGFALLAGFLQTVPADADQPSKPNVLLILADDVGREVLGCYGGSSYQTPRIDRLAGQGMMFHNCYSMPSCHPTRISLMTGRYPVRFGNPKWGTFPTAAERKTIGWQMKAAGYRTVVAGKWQVTTLGKDLDHPHRLGFDEYALFGWHEGPRYYDPLIWKNGARWEGVEKKYGPDLYVDFLIDFIKRSADEPFFAYYPMALCHDVTDDIGHPVPFGPRGRYDSFAEMVADMDRCVGRLLDALDELNHRDDTVVLYTTDNGTPFRSMISATDSAYIREPVVSEFQGRIIPGGKTKLTDWGTRVPLLVRWPGVVRPGTQSDAMVDMTDFLPTVAALAGRPAPADWSLDGKNFLPVLRDPAAAGKPWIFAQQPAGKPACVRTQRWKLYDNGRLYDLQRDGDEQHPLEKPLSEEAEQARKKLGAILAGLLKK